MNWILLDDNQKHEVIELYKKGAPIGRLIKDFNCGYSQIKNIINKSGVEQRFHSEKYFPSQIPEILRLFSEGETTENIGKRFNTNRSSIQNAIKKYGGDLFEKETKRRDGRRDVSKNVKDNLFDDLLKEEAAWLLGFIHSDGSLGKEEGDLSICFQEKDEELINKFKNIIDGGSTYFNKKKRYYHFRWRSKIMYRKLYKLGITQRKSLVIGMPKTENICWKSFLRGVFEGDGCVTLKDGMKGLNCYICSGSKKFALELRELLISNGFKAKIGDTARKEMYYIYPSGNREKVKFLGWLYDGAEFFLSRKLKVYQDFLKMNPIYTNKDFLESSVRNYEPVIPI